MGDSARPDTMSPRHVHGGPGYQRCSNRVCKDRVAADRRALRAAKREQLVWDPTQQAWYHPGLSVLHPGHGTGPWHATVTGYDDWLCRCKVVPGTTRPGCLPIGRAAAAAKAARARRKSILVEQPKEPRGTRETTPSPTPPNRREHPMTPQDLGPIVGGLCIALAIALVAVVAASSHGRTGHHRQAIAPAILRRGITANIGARHAVSPPTAMAAAPPHPPLDQARLVSVDDLTSTLALTRASLRPVDPDDDIDPCAVTAIVPLTAPVYFDHDGVAPYDGRHRRADAATSGMWQAVIPRAV